MQKNNQKGFMLVEAFIVSTFVLGVLVFMFIQLRTVVNGYDRSFSYNTVPGIYIANEIGKFVVNFDYENTKQTVDNAGYVIKNIDSYSEFDYAVSDTWNAMLQDANVKTVIIATEDATILKEAKNGQISSKLEDYIDYLNVGNLTNRYRIIVEFNDETFASVKLA